VFVKFLDGHELIWFKDRNPQEVYFYDEVDEVELNGQDV